MTLREGYGGRERSERYKVPERSGARRSPAREADDEWRGTRPNKKRSKNEFEALYMNLILFLRIFKDVREHQWSTDGCITFNDEFRCCDIQFTPGNFLVRNCS